MRVERFVAQDEVLSEVDLVVSHGGSGSLMAALAHGLPSVLLPLGARPVKGEVTTSVRCVGAA